MLTNLAASALLTLTTLPSARNAPSAPEPIRTLLITGHNNHNWPYTSRLHRDTLEATGRFAVTITDDPARTLADPKAIEGVRVFVLDYNDFGAPKRWGDAAEKNFVRAVQSGAGVVAVHSANNAFPGWFEYEKMLGLMWREGTGHGKFHAFDVEWTDADHPITRGLSTFTAHPDELYHSLVNSHKVPFHLLGRALSSKDSGGTGRHEPMALTLEFGKGRIFATPLGHVWLNSEESKASVADPRFKALLCRGTEWAATGAVTQGTTWSDTRPHNTLTDAEKKDGWMLLFDGVSTPALRGWKKDALPARWVVKDGEFRLNKGESEGGDVCTREEYADFEFACDWKVAKGGNSGIMYRCTEDHTYPWETGPEMQILDNANHGDGKKPRTSAGSLYDLVECAFDVARPAGEWNHARLVVRGSRIEHWLNGFKVVDIDAASDDFKKRHAESKWPGMKDFNTKPKGRIALQDHGDEVAFRNLKVRVLK
ncbi:MAG: DUF1080 domain-containing protein [Phycisphaerae bacterium]|nr:DUF1080 domain-containing protein [Phycisphaerae bacterium]